MKINWYGAIYLAICMLIILGLSVMHLKIAVDYSHIGGSLPSYGGFAYCLGCLLMVASSSHTSLMPVFLIAAAFTSFWIF